MRLVREGCRLAARALSLRSSYVASSNGPAAADVSQRCLGVSSLQQRFLVVPASAQDCFAAAAAAGSATGGGEQPDQQSAEQQQREQQQQAAQPASSAAASSQAAVAAAVQDRGERSGQPRQPWRRGGPHRHVLAGGEGGSGPRPRAPRTSWPTEPPPITNRRDRLVPILLHYKHSCAEVVELMQEYRDSLSVRELTVACTRLGRLYSQGFQKGRSSGSGGAPVPARPPSAGFTAANNAGHCAALFQLAAPYFGTFDTQALATAMWMCARFHWLPPPELRAAWENAAWARRGQINLIETANISFSLGVLHWAPVAHPLLEALLDSALARRGELTPWMICNMMWGSARVACPHFHPGPERVTQLVELCLPQLDTFLPESFCSLLFSLACLRCRPDDAVLTAILDQFEWLVPESSNRQLVTSVWAMGALQISGLITERLWERIETAVASQGDQFNFSSAPLFLFGAARMQLQPDYELMRLMLRKSLELKSQLRTGDVSVVLWALARLNHKVGEGLVTPDFVAQMVQQWLDHHQGKPATMRHVSALLWACANLKYALPKEQLQHIIAEVDALAARHPLTTTDATMLLSAFETFGSSEGLAFLKCHLMSGMPGSFGGRRRGRGGELGLDAHAAAEGGGGGGSDLDLDLAEEVTPLGR